LASLKLGAQVVPVYHTLPAESVRYILHDAEVTHIVVEDQNLLNNIMSIIDSLPSLTHIVHLGETPASNPGNGRLLPFSRLRTSGAAALTNDPALNRPCPVQPDAIATICYTSGTTGEPKGAMLTHQNILSNVLSAIEWCNINEKDVLLSFLPLCHMFERTCGYYSLLLAGACIAYAESVQTVAQDARTIRPTLMIVVPRVLEKAYSTVVERVLKGPALQRRLMAAALRSHTRYARLRHRGQRIPLRLALVRWLTGLLVVRRLHRLAGGRLRMIFSGAAPLDRRLANIFRAFGFNLLEGYGLTEAAPVICAALPGHERVGTVGRPFPGVEVRIGANSEVLVRGPNVMKGYLNKPEETARTIDQDGWLHTGDQGRFDEFGNLIITGRIKELIVNSYGKNIAPVPIEQALISSPYIEQALVIGDRRPFLSALIVPCRNMLENWAQTKGISANDYHELLLQPRVTELFRSEINRLTASLAPYEQVREFRLIPEPYTVENGLLTPTLKLRRRQVEEIYRNEIESMYRE
ncbi:MAG: long-chain fatty acid--CoA ligase, partial [candidate division WOR-3 bacterium]